MSTIGTSLAQAAAGADHAERTAARAAPAKRSREAERRDVRKADTVEVAPPPADAVEAGKRSDQDGANGQSRERARRQQQQNAENPPAKRLDLQG